MELNRFTDYSLRVLIYLALYPERPHATSEIAASYGISSHHLSKVVQRLHDLGYVTTQRGRYGGASLAQAPRQISVGNLVRELEPMSLVECLNKSETRCVIEPACGLKRALKQARRAFLQVLDSYTLQDLTRSRKLLHSLLPSQV